MVAQSSMMARATSDSFLLKYFQPESIPLMIMAAASLSIVLALFTTYLCGRFQAYGAMRYATSGIVFTLLAMVCIVYFFGNKGETKPIYVFAYMLCETIVILPMVLFWGMAVGVLNPTESKRWMGLIGAAGTLGCILAGFTISVVSKHEYVNELSLGMVAVVLMVVSLILMIRAKLFQIKDENEAPVAGQSNSVIRKLGVLISSKQSILMTWLVVFSAIVLSLVDINFKFEVRKDYSEDLYDFFGQFYTYTSCAQLLLQLFIVRAILTKGGVWAAISILPILLLLTAIGALLFTRQDAVYVGKFITQVVFFTIEYVGLQMLFLSVKKKLRGQMNSAVDGLTRPATIAIISLLITSTLPFWQGGTESDSVWRLNLIIIVLCLCWLFVAFLNYRQYLASLLSMVGAKIDINPILPKSKPLAKKEFSELLKKSNFLTTAISKIPQDKQLESLNLAFIRAKDQKIKAMGDLLVSFNQSIDYQKIFTLIQAKEADVKAEAIEVLKGVIGPSRTDLILKTLNSHENRQDREDVDFIFENSDNYSSDDIMYELLGVVTNKDFAKRKLFVLHCLKNENERTRLKALRVFLDLESDSEQKKQVLEDLKNDPCPEIVGLVQKSLI